MSDGRVELSFGLLKTAPQVAASVLESQPVEAAAYFLETAPARLAGPALAAMTPFHGARCLQQMEAQAAVALLREVPAAIAANVLRQWPPQQRDGLVEKLPRRQALGLRVMLGYPVVTVGAWMDAQPALLLLEQNVATALQQLREEARELDSTVPVIDREQRLQGCVRTSALLCAEDNTPLAALLEPAATHLLARADLLRCRDHSAWENIDVLPVLRRDGRVVGVLRHAGLRRGLLAVRAVEAGEPGDRLLQLADGYWLGLVKMLETVLGLIPSRQRTNPQLPRDSR